MGIRIFVVSAVILITVASGYFLKKKNDTYFSQGLKSSILKKLPTSKMKDLYKDKEVDLQSLKADKNLFVHFWATWCAPCEVEFPGLMELVDNPQVSAKNTFVFVAVNDQVKKVKKFLKKFGADKRKNVYFLIDNEAKTESQFGVFKLPETFVFTKGAGDLKNKFAGPQEWRSNHFFRVLSSN